MTQDNQQLVTMQACEERSTALAADVAEQLRKHTEEIKLTVLEASKSSFYYKDQKREINVKSTRALGVAAMFIAGGTFCGIAFWVLRWAHAIATS